MSSAPEPRGSITIDGMPVLIDHQCQLRKFMDDRLPSSDVLFAREMIDEVAPNPMVGLNHLELPYPKLPKIEVGELQFPSGASRYGRALFAVDWATLNVIAESGWGYTPSATPPVDVPNSWGVNHYPVEVKFQDGVNTFTLSMYPLAPYRVPGFGGQLWLLPLVDQRFIAGRRPHEPDTVAPETWETLFSDLAAEMGMTVAVDAVPAAYTDPDFRLWKHAQPAAELMDAAALSVGMRVVFEPTDEKLRVVSANNSTLRRLQRTSDVRYPLLSGGRRGTAAKVRGVDVYCMRCPHKYEKHSSTIGGGPGTVNLAVYSSWYLDYNEAGTLVNSAATATFVDRVATDLNAWADSGGQYCYAGAIDYKPTGFDDYLSVQVLEDSNQSLRYHSRIYELPSVFMPRVVLVGGEEDPGSFFLFTMTEDMGPDYGAATIQTMDDTETVDTANVVNTLGNFNHLETGDRGVAVRVDCLYYAIGPYGDATAGHVFSLNAALSGGVGNTASATVLVSGEAGVTAGQTITVYNTGGKSGPASAVGWCVKIGDQYWVVEIDQYALYANVVFTSDTHTFSGGQYGGVAQQLAIAVSSMTTQTPYPFSIIPSPFPTIHNPKNLVAETGDTGTVIYDTTDGRWELAEVYPQRAKQVFFKLSGNWPNGLQQSVTSWFPISPAPPHMGGDLPLGTEELFDRYMLAPNARIDDVGIAQWDYVAQRWEIIAMEHRCLRGEALVKTEFCGTPSTFTVFSVVGYDGYAPTGDLVVQNRMSIFAAEVDQRVEIRWDSIEGEYYALPIAHKEPAFFELTENMTPVVGEAWATARAMATFQDWDGNTLFSDYLYSWEGIIDDKQTGFRGTAEWFCGRWRFEQAPC